MAQYQTPGGPYIVETGTEERQTPGGPMINETQAAAATNYPQKQMLLGVGT